MRQQTKSFTVEVKQSRKLKSGDEKPSIWGKLDLSIAEDGTVPTDQSDTPLPSG
jgi:hypothetical protein